MIVVSDTSAITALLQIGRIAILLDLYGDVFVPDAVRAELGRAHDRLPDFIHVVAVKDRTRCDSLNLELDSGESEAIVLAHELRADLLLMDERRGRRVAIREGLQVIGLLGVLLYAKQRGLIPALRPLVDELEAETGFRVAGPVREHILRAAGE